MMYPVSEDFLRAQRAHAERTHRVVVSRDSGRTWAEVPALGYRIEATRGDRVQIRYSGQVDLPPGQGEFSALAGILVRVESGFVIDGEPERVPIATLQITSTSVDRWGGVELSGYSVDRRIGRANFYRPYYMGGGAVRPWITDLLSVARVPISIDPRVGEQHVAAATYTSDRWAAVADLALSVGAEVYADRLGGITVAPVPTLHDPVAATLAGVVTDHQAAETAEDAVSVVVVEGDRSNQSAVPRGYWRDEDPFSPTFVGGPFGEQVRRVSLPVATSIQQCIEAARTIGLGSRGTRSSVDVTLAQADYLDPGDVVLVPMPDGSLARHLIDRVPYASGASPQRLTTRSG